MIATAVDAILVLVVIEGVALTLLHRRTGRGLAARVLWPNLVAGFLLMLGIRVALADGAAPAAAQAFLAALLAGALGAHVLDLAVRWPGRLSG